MKVDYIFVFWFHAGGILVKSNGLKPRRNFYCLIMSTVHSSSEILKAEEMIILFLVIKKKKLIIIIENYFKLIKLIGKLEFIFI